MKKNTASQRIGAQMVSATDGSAFTGTVTVYVTIDGGTQAIGTVGSGVCTHEGNGFHTYAPSQAETNGDHLAFTFIGTGAVPATVQVFTNFPQTGDGFARLGAPVGASISADVAAVQADTDNLQTRIPAALVSGRIDASIGASAVALAITSNVKKNQALAKFAFLMTDSTNHAPATGKTVTCTRSIDGGAFGAGTLASVTEIGNGIYTVDFGAGDLNGNVILLRCTATACDDAFERIVTQP